MDRLRIVMSFKAFYFTGKILIFHNKMENISNFITAFGIGISFEKATAYMS